MGNNNLLVKENQKLKRAVQELSLLNELARTIGASTNLEKIMQKIIHHSLQAVQAEQCTITLIQEQSQEAMKTLVRSMASSAEQNPFHLDQVLLGWMLKNKRPLSIADPKDDARFSNLKCDRNIHSLLSVPLLVKSKLIGILTAVNKKNAKVFTTEDKRLLGIIAAQSAQIIENARLSEEEKKLLKIREEMNLAKQIQTDLLPKKMPDIPGYDIYGTSIPAQNVGGDYFDFIPIDDHRLAVCLADVSGKGLPASLLMSNLQAIMRSQILTFKSPAECLNKANKILYINTASNKFATLFFGVLDFQKNQFCYANAGHDRPILFRAKGKVEQIQPAGLPMGFLEEATYSDHCFEFGSESLLCIYTDGISEAMNEKEKEFGVSRIIHFLTKERKQTASVLIQGLLNEVNEHAAGYPQSDDMTVVIVKKTT